MCRLQYPVKVEPLHNHTTTTKFLYILLGLLSESLQQSNVQLSRSGKTAHGFINVLQFKKRWKFFRKFVFRWSLLCRNLLWPQFQVKAFFGDYINFAHLRLFQETLAPLWRKWRRYRGDLGHNQVVSLWWQCDTVTWFSHKITWRDKWGVAGLGLLTVRSLHINPLSPPQPFIPAWRNLCENHLITNQTELYL